MSTPALNLVNVTLEYPDGDSGTLKALDNVSLSAAAGTITSLVGPSGSGKSSLLAVAATLVRPTSGHITINGIDATTLTDHERTTLRREEVGIIFQQPNLLASLTAMEQLIVGEHLRGTAPRAARPAQWKCWTRLAFPMQPTAATSAIGRTASTRQHRPGTHGRANGAAGR